MFGRNASELKYLLQLVQCGVARKDGLAHYEFGQNATYTPYISFFAIVLGAQEHLGGPVPSGGHFLREDHLVVFFAREASY